MKFTKKWFSTKDKRRSSAGMFYTSSAGAVTSLILMFAFGLTGATNLFGLGGSAYADYTLSMTSSGAQSIDVAPSSSGIGTSIGEDAITVSTTCRSGYNLSMSTSVNDNKLYLDGNSSSSSYFSPVDGTSPLANSTNKWGYYFNDSSTAPTPSNVFSAIPALGSTAVIKSPLPTPSSTDIEDSFSIYYGVGVNSNLTPGTYKMKPDTNNSNADGTVVYYLTMADECIQTKIYMQDVTNEELAIRIPNNGDSTTLYDKRDENDYQVTKINGQYWMTQNLRFTGSNILATTSNVNSNKTLTWYSLKKDAGSSSAKCYGSTNSGNGYSNACKEDSGSTETGVWYNYYGVTAGTISGLSNSTIATQDICPKNWHLPTGPNTTSGTDTNKLFGNTISGYQEPTSSLLLFNAVGGGRYTNGEIIYPGTGFWWNANASSASKRYKFLRSSDGRFHGDSDYERPYGFNARCVRYPAYSISFNANGGSGNMPNQTIYNNNGTLNTNAFTAPTEKVFKNWNTKADGSGTSYTNGATVTNLAGDGETITLYAQWGVMLECNPSGTTISNVVCMQDITSNNKSTILNSMTQGTQYQLYDNRDGRQYWVAKQADGNVWMTQNLNLDIGGSGVATLTSENTDLNTSGSAPYVDGYSTSGGVITWSPASTATTSGRTISGTTVTGWTDDNNVPYSAEGGDRYYYTTGTESSETAQTLAECIAVSGRSEELCAHYHSGNYYNWTAAIASNASNGISTRYDVAANSICPKGWKLPQGTASSYTSATRQFGYLWQMSGVTSSLTATSFASGGFNKIRTSPLFFVRGGYVNGSSLYHSGYYGYYWSSPVSSTSTAYYASFNPSSIGSANGTNRYRGQSLRCMVR